MKRVVIESPLSGDFARNIRYARLCVIDSLRRGEAPYASHLLFTQVLDDTIREDRARGMAAGLVWAAGGEFCAPYVDLRITDGMRQGIAQATTLNIPVEHRVLPQYLMDQLNTEAPRAIRRTKGIR